MNKMKKLLSVVLAVVIALSALSVLGSAARTAYKTVDELNALAAYSPYGQVTRLTTEERTSIVFDALDNVLAQANINMGEVFNVLGLSVTIDLTSIDRLCYSLDTIDSTFANFLFTIAKGIVNLGILEDLSFSTWDKNDMTRDNQAQLTILTEVLELLSNNSGVVGSVLSSGKLDLGIISLGDMSAIEDVLGDIPGLIKGLVFPLLERWDDTLEEVKNYDTWGKGNGNVNTALNYRLNALFSDDMSITTVKYDVNGVMTSEHTNMPIQTTAPATGVITNNAAPRCVYVVNGTTPGSVMTVYHLVDEKEAKDLAKNPDDVNGSPAAYSYFKEAQTYVMTQEVPGSETYVWQATDEWGNKWSMKWYNDNSPFLPSFAADNGQINITSTSVADLLYKMIPYVFEEMAPVVLNGSVKKILAEFFGARFKYVGQGGPEADDAVKALGTNTFFTQEQEEYLWEWSDYAVIDGNHYYRFEDQIFAADLSWTNNYFDIINWDYVITADFMNEFVPAAGAGASDRLLLNLNDFLVKVANTALVASNTTDDHKGFEAQWTRPTLAKGTNEANLIPNIKLLAQTVIGLAPQHIFGSDYATNDRCYYSLMMSTDNQTILTGIAAHLVDMIMPTMTLPGAKNLIDSKATVGAILAAVVREFAASLVPEYNYDALIYADYGTTAADPDKTFIDPTSLLSTGETIPGYWLDVILTMGIDVGYEYIRAFADLGEDSAEVLTGVVEVGYGADGKTYAAGTTQAQLNAQWEGMLDYIIDWALENGKEWTWKMENLVNTSGLTIDLATAQDPWQKLQTVLGSILPVDEILTVTPDAGQTKIEHFLREDLILGIVNLEWAHLIDTLQFNGTNQYFRTANVADQLAKLLKGIVNSLFAKVGNANGNFALIPAAVTNFDTLANQANIATLAQNLVGALKGALIDRGLADTAFPFVNFFLGWKTDPQVVADLQMWTSFRDNQDYAFQWADNGVHPNIDDGATVIKVLNNSSGMLEKHRDSTVTDHAYDINIKSVTSDATVNTIDFRYDNVVSPYETVDIVVTGTYKGEEAITVTVEYDYLGKDGKAVGGTQYTSLTFFISNKYEDALIEGRLSGDDKDGKYGIDPFKKYQFTEDLYTTVTEFQPAVWGTNETGGGTCNFHWIQAPARTDVGIDCDKKATGSGAYVDMNDLAKTYFQYNDTQAKAGFASSFEKDGSTSGKLYAAKSGVTAETEFPYGVYDMGKYAIAYSDDVKSWEIDYIYYNDFDIDLMWADFKDKAITVNDVDTSDTAAVAAYNTYNTALKNVCKLATYPMMVDYTTTIQPQIEAAKEALEIAYEALEPYMADAQGSAGADANLPTYVQDLEAQLATDDGDGEVEINYTDYQYYEYFNYADLRTEARNLVKTYYAPEVMDTYYILNSGIREAELNDVIDAEANEAKAAGITASRLTNDQAAIDASITARDEWKQPVHSELYIDDMASRLAYYKTFLAGHEENDDHLQFLNKEIAHVEAQQYVEAKYTADSWARYAAALAAAKEIAADAEAGLELNSQIYNAKRELMIARKNLLLKTESLIETGGTAALLANIELAEAIFATNYDDIQLSEAGLALAADPAEAKNIALGHLIQGLGYYYTGQDGNEWNLYADSAYEYADNDRHMRQSNQNKVDACNGNLEACIAYFATAEEPAEPNTIMLKEDAPFEAIIDTVNCGDYNGAIYGFDTLGWNDEFVVDGAIADFVTTAYGDDYLEVVVGEAGVETTGTVINVLDKEGNVVESYVYIYFGDIDMDGNVGAVDAGMAEYYEMYYEGFDTLYQFMAGDLDGDAMPGAVDAGIMEFWEMNYYGMVLQSEVGAVASGIEYVIF